MIITVPDRWNADFAVLSPLYAPLHAVAKPFARFRDRWPELIDYQHVLDMRQTPVLTATGQRLRITAQETGPLHFDARYAPRVYLTGDLQTRRHNWHDFFQFLTWLVFPGTKAAINARHIPHARARIADVHDTGRRSPVENMLSLFDEGGAVVMSSDPSLLQLIRDFQWQCLFRDRRDEIAEKLQCITFGHAVYEKALRPYLGMTANAILLEVDSELLKQPIESQSAAIDARLADLLSPAGSYSQPRDLQPFPLLGMPGWDPANASPDYYHNTDYFRPGRRRQAASSA